MANKLVKFILGSAAILATAAVAGCDDIEAKPNWNEDKTIINVDGELTNNQLQNIYDALVKSGTSNSEKVLTNVLKELSKGYFGDFYGDNGLLAIVNKAKVGDKAALNAFVEESAHSVYSESLDKEEDKANAGERVIMYVDYLVKKINEEFLSIVKNSSYQEKNCFKEVEWIKSIKSNGYKVEAPATPVEKMVNGNVDYKTVNEYFAADYMTRYQDYIERSILPSLYQNKLVEYFIAKNNPGALGRTYARNIDYIKVSDNSEYPTAMKKLTKAYATKVINTGLYGTYGFDFLSDLVKGTINYNGSEANEVLAKEIYQAADFDLTNAQTVTYTILGEAKTLTAPVETTLGGYIKEYNKITDNRFTNDTSAYDDFTSNGAYIKEVGLQSHYDSLVAQASIANDGWYTSSSLSGIPTELKNRLFKVRVSTEVDTKVDTPSYGVYPVSGSKDYFLTPETYESSNDLPYVVYSDSASYIVKVNEAISVSKLQKSTADSYDVLKPGETLFREKIAYEAAHLISDNDTYTKNAKQYFIEKAAIAFHDDYVYDYFADMFPDLFDSNED